MARKSVFNSNYNWYKGNLHSHTTQSDGKLTPKELADLYQSSGWNFLAITDHELYSHWDEFNNGQFLILPGLEVEAGQRQGRRCHHIVGINKDGNGAQHLEKRLVLSQTGVPAVQREIDNLVAENHLVVYCHPVWSRQEWPDISTLRNVTAMEIYNHGCEMESRTGYSLSHWDSFLRRGIKIWGVATDDSHQWLNDYCGGWIVVNAPELSVKEITTAIVDGRFYSSTGPTITDFGVDGDEVYIECSAAKAVHFVAYEKLGRSFYAEAAATLRGASHRLDGAEIFVRAEVVDEQGRIAWTNPIFLDELRLG